MTATATNAPRARLRRPSDTGSTIIETAIVMPALMLMVMLVVQVALVWHARHVAAQAADRALTAARSYQATAHDGETTATSYLHDVAPTLLHDPDIQVTRTATTVQVSVRAQVLSVVPAFGLTDITETATGPVERFTTPGGNG